MTIHIPGMRFVVTAASAALLAMATACGAHGSAAAGHHRHASTHAATGVTLTASTTPACTTAHLAVWLGIGPGGAAGSTYYPIEFTNVSSSSCHLYGYPGVSATNGQQVGRAAGRAPSSNEHTVTLAAGATAHAVLQIVDVSALPPTTCKPVKATGLQVYPPGETASATIPFSFRACSGTGVTYMYVTPVLDGVGVPGH
jgi:hypothetical protein